MHKKMLAATEHKVLFLSKLGTVLLLGKCFWTARTLKSWCVVVCEYCSKDFGVTLDASFQLLGEFFQRITLSQKYDKKEEMS